MSYIWNKRSIKRVFDALLKLNTNYKKFIKFSKNLDHPIHSLKLNYVHGVYYNENISSAYVTDIIRLTPRDNMPYKVLPILPTYKRFKNKEGDWCYYLTYNFYFDIIPNLKVLGEQVGEDLLKHLLHKTHVKLELKDSTDTHEYRIDYNLKLTVLLNTKTGTIDFVNLYPNNLLTPTLYPSFKTYFEVSKDKHFISYVKDTELPDKDKINLILLWNTINPYYSAADSELKLFYTLNPDINLSSILYNFLLKNFYLIESFQKIPQILTP